MRPFSLIRAGLVGSPRIGLFNRKTVQLIGVRGVASVKATDDTLQLADSFWDKVSVEIGSDNSRTVTLAKKPLKTPSGNNIVIPSTKPAALAELVAQEWSIMTSLKLKNHHIPITSLAARSIDITPEERATVTEKLLPYLDTDTLLVLAPQKDCEGTLRAAQLKLFPDVIDDACKVWGIPGLKVLDTEEMLFGNYQEPEVRLKVQEWIDGLDNWQFASLERATTAARSLIVGMNIVLQRRTVEELSVLTSLDVIHQTEMWGEVEDTHDVDHEDIRRLLGAAYINAL